MQGKFDKAIDNARTEAKLQNEIDEKEKLQKEKAILESERVQIIEEKATLVKENREFQARALPLAASTPYPFPRRCHCRL